MSAKHHSKIWPHTLNGQQVGLQDPFLLPTFPQAEIGYDGDPADFDDSFMLEPKKESRSKVALYRCTRVLGRVLVHLAPVTITTGVLSLTFLQRFWTTPSSQTNTVLNMLQFAAQLHGSLIIMSLSAIILDLVRHKLKRKQGIPHGLLSSSFQLNSLSYLFGTEFWSGWKQKGNGDLAFLATFLFVFVLALGCQPSSAIAMIPRLQFWPVHDISPQYAIQYHAYVSANDRTLYPNFLTAANAGPLCSAPNASISSSCPSAGIAGILSQDVLFDLGGHSERSQGQPAINLTVDSGWRRQIIGSERPVYQDIYSSYTARTLSNFLGAALQSFAQDLVMFNIPYINNPNIQRLDEKLLARYDLSFISGGKKITTKRPRVEVQCAGFQADAAEVTFPQNFGTSRGAALTVPSSQFRDLSADTDSQAVNFTWVDVTQFRDSNPSLLGIFATPTIYDYTATLNSSVPSNDMRNHTFTFYPCTIDASWESTDVYYDASSGSAIVYDSHPNSGASAPEDSIQIHPDFAALLDNPYLEGNIRPTPTNKSVLQSIGEKCLLKNTIVNSTILGTPLPDGQHHNVISDQMALLQCFQVSLSIYLVDALSRVQDHLPAYFVASIHNLPNDYRGTQDVYYAQDLYDTANVNVYTLKFNGLTQADFDDAERFIEISMPLSRYGYGYGFAESRLIYVAATILLVHVTVCIAHIIWIAVTNPRGEMGWETLGELIEVLLRTPVAERGIPLLKTKGNWCDRILVREMDDDGKSQVGESLSASDAKHIKRKASTLMVRRVPASSRD